MERKILYMFLVFCVTIFGCSTAAAPTQLKSITNNEDVKLTPEDLNDFIQDYYISYCDLRSMSAQFWNDYYNPAYTSLREKAGTDIPVMNMIGESMLNRIKINNTLEKNLKVNESVLKNDFTESLRLLNISNDFLFTYFKGSSELKDFKEFTTSVAQQQTAFGESVAKIQVSLTSDYEILLKNKPELYSPESQFVNIIEMSCDERIANEKVESDLKVADSGAKEAYIILDDVSGLSRSVNGAYYLTGSTSDNCESITVLAINSTANVKDTYKLSDYSKGDTSFKYGIRSDWNNVGVGSNQYTLTAVCGENQIKTTSTSLTYKITSPVNNFNFPSTNSYAPGYSTLPTSAYTNSTSGYKTFGNYGCTEDCSGHEAGYEWAERKGIDDTYDCGGNSNSFIEGCNAYVEENY